MSQILLGHGKEFRFSSQCAGKSLKGLRKGFFLSFFLSFFWPHLATCGILLSSPTRDQTHAAGSESTES